MREQHWTFHSQLLERASEAKSGPLLIIKLYEEMLKLGLDFQPREEWQMSALRPNMWPALDENEKNLLLLTTLGHCMNMLMKIMTAQIKVGDPYVVRRQYTRRYGVQVFDLLRDMADSLELDIADMAQRFSDSINGAKADQILDEANHDFSYGREFHQATESVARDFDRIRRHQDEPLKGLRAVASKILPRLTALTDDNRSKSSSAREATFDRDLSGIKDDVTDAIGHIHNYLYTIGTKTGREIDLTSPDPLPASNPFARTLREVSRLRADPQFALDYAVDPKDDAESNRIADLQRDVTVILKQMENPELSSAQKEALAVKLQKTIDAADKEKRKETQRMMRRITTNANEKNKYRDIGLLETKLSQKVLPAAAQLLWHINNLQVNAPAIEERINALQIPTEAKLGLIANLHGLVAGADARVLRIRNHLDRLSKIAKIGFVQENIEQTVIEDAPETDADQAKSVSKEPVKLQRQRKPLMGAESLKYRAEKDEEEKKKGPQVIPMDVQTFGCDLPLEKGAPVVPAIGAIINRDTWEVSYYQELQTMIGRTESDRGTMHQSLMTDLPQKIHAFLKGIQELEAAQAAGRRFKVAQAQDGMAALTDAIKKAEEAQKPATARIIKRQAQPAPG